MNEKEIEKALGLVANDLRVTDQPRMSIDNPRHFCIYRVPNKFRELSGDMKPSDEEVLIVDFEKRTLRYSLWMESYHNGSSYGERSYDLDFEAVTYLDDIVVKMLMEREEKIMEEEEKNYRRAMLRARALSRLK
jgi:hypothetical protein